MEQVCGIEPSAEPISQAAPDIQKFIRNDVFRNGMFEDETFDMVSLFQTIEHIPEPASSLKEIKRILKSGGYFYLVCHDYKSLVNKMLGMKSPVYDIEHLHIFSKKSIVLLMQKTGFREIKLFTVKNKYALSYWIKLFPMPLKLKTMVLGKIRNTKLGQKKVGINAGNIGLICRK